MANSRNSKFGIAREATWGDAAAPQVMLPVDPPSITDNFETLLDQTVRGINVMDFGSYQGVGSVEASLSGIWFPEEVPFILLAMLGSVSSTGTAAPYTHTFTLANQPPSLSFQDEGAVYPEGGNARRYAGMLPSSLTLTFSSEEGLLTWSADFSGKRGTAPASGSIPADATNPPFRGWHGTMTIAGAPATRLIDLELTFEREIQIRWGADGTQYPVAGHSGGIAVTGSMTLDATASTELDYVLTHAENAVVITFSYGSGAGEKQLSISIPRFNWGDSPAELDRSAVAITLSCTGRAIYDRDTSTLVTATVKNSRQNYNAA